MHVWARMYDIWYLLMYTCSSKSIQSIQSIQSMQVSAYRYLCTCILSIHLCMYIHVCIWVYMYISTPICVCNCLCMHIIHGCCQYTCICCFSQYNHLARIKPKCSELYRYVLWIHMHECMHVYKYMNKHDCRYVY